MVKIIGEFNLVLDFLDYAEITLGIILDIILLVGFGLFLKKYKNSDNNYFFYVSIMFLCYFIGMTLRLILKFVVGKPPLDQPYEGAALIVQIFRVTIIAAAYFVMLFHLESTKIRKSHYIFSTFTIITLIITLIALFERSLLYLSLLFLIITGIALPLLFLGIALKSDGIIRIKAIIIGLGFLLIAVATMFDGTEPSFYEPFLGDFSLIFATFSINILFIIAWLLLIYGFQKRIT